jgi:hypothetical protein
MARHGDHAPHIVVDQRERLAARPSPSARATFKTHPSLRLEQR